MYYHIQVIFLFDNPMVSFMKLNSCYQFKFQCKFNSSWTVAGQTIVMTVNISLWTRRWNVCWLNPVLFICWSLFWGQSLCLYGLCSPSDHFLLFAVVTRLSAVSVIVRPYKQGVVTYLQYLLLIPASANHLQDVYDLQIAACPKHAHYF